MMLRYHCACCNHVLLSSDKECPHCGSHHIRSPISLWIFCVIASLVVVMTFSLIRVYIKNHDDAPKQQTILDFLNKDRSQSNNN